MAGVSFGAAADGLVVFYAAVGVLTARSRARIDALEAEAGLAAAAVLVLRALRVAARERIAQEVLRTRADGPVVLIHPNQKFNQLKITNAHKPRNSYL